MIIARIVAVVAALLLGIQVVRTAAVSRLAAAEPASAERIWPGHPAADISLAMTQIAQAAHDRRAVPGSTFELMRDAAAREPLAPEPFLVRGVQAQLAGDGASAQRAFEAAQWRDPRSLPAAFFLAERYFRAGDTKRGLGEVAALARLAPHGANIVGPYIAAYARNPATWLELRTMFRANDELAQATLVTLASDFTTVPAALALVDLHRGADREPWFAPLLNTLTQAGQYAKARSVWATSTGAKGDTLIYDAAFSDKTAPPPFNWALASSAVGLAERQPGGRLHVVFYGHEDGILATQLLLLAPGAYRLSMQLLGDPARAKSLTWSIWCDKAAAPIASVTLDAAARGWKFRVPAGCGAQWLRLSGFSIDIPEQADEIVARLKLEKVAAGA